MENIGILNTPNETGASIKCTSNYFNTNDTELLTINNIGSIRTNITDRYKSVEITSDLDPWDVTGSAISLRSKTAEYYPSNVSLVSRLNEQTTTMELFPDGTISSWYSDNNSSSNRYIEMIINESNNYIQYANGLLIQWGRNYIPIDESTKTISFYIPYKNNDDNAYDVYITSNCNDIVSYIFHAYYKSASDFTAISHLSDGTLSGHKYFKWLSVGRWK